MRKENAYQAGLIKRLKQMFPGCLVIKLDANYLQGLPDLLILFENKWAVLECKRSESSTKRPNQEYYVGMMDQMSFARFIFPENEKEVLNDLQQAFRA